MIIFNSYVSLPEGIYYRSILGEKKTNSQEPNIGEWCGYRIITRTRVKEGSPCYPGFDCHFSVARHNGLLVIFFLHSMIWWLPKIGLPPVIIHFRWGFSIGNHPAMGDPPMETSISQGHSAAPSGFQRERKRLIDDREEAARRNPVVFPVGSIWRKIIHFCRWNTREMSVSQNGSF